MATPQCFVLFFFLFGIAGVCPQFQGATQTGRDVLPADENSKYDRMADQYGTEEKQLLRAKRIVPEPRGPWLHPSQEEQEAAREEAAMERQRKQIERETSERRAQQASRRLAAEERARRMGETELRTRANRQRGNMPMRRRSDSLMRGNRQRSRSPMIRNRQRSRSSTS